MQIKEKALELGREIRETPEYQELQRAGDNLKEDQAAQKMIQGVQEAQQQLAFMQKTGVQPNQEQLDELKGLQENMQTNLTVQVFMKAQEGFNSVLKEVNDAISEGITGEVPPEE